MDAALRLAHGGEHLLAERGGLLAQARHRVAHEGVDALGDLGRRALGRLPPGFDERLPVALGDELRLQALRHPDLEEARLEAEVAVEAVGGRERRLDGGDDARGVAHELRGRLAPFRDGRLAQRLVAPGEGAPGLRELRLQLVEPDGGLAELAVGQEAADAAEERERGRVDDGVGPGFDQGELRQRLARQQPLVAEADEAFRHVVGVEPHVLRVELLARPPVADVHRDEHALAGQHVEQLLVVVHGMISLGLGVSEGQGSGFRESLSRELCRCTRGSGCRL